MNIIKETILDILSIPEQEHMDDMKLIDEFHEALPNVSNEDFMKAIEELQNEDRIFIDLVPIKGVGMKSYYKRANYDIS